MSIDCCGATNYIYIGGIFDDEGAFTECSACGHRPETPVTAHSTQTAFRRFRQSVNHTTISHRSRRPEPLMLFDLDEARETLRNDGCVWILDGSEDSGSEMADYPVECIDELEDHISWCYATGESILLLSDHRSQAAVDFDRAHPDVLLKEINEELGWGAGR